MAYRQLVRDVRSTGWWNILWGGLTLWLGIDGFGVRFGDTVQVIFGVLLLAQSGWAIARLSSKNLLLLVVLFLFAGIWNIGLAVAVGFTGLSILTAILGGFQLRWASQTYRNYQQLVKGDVKAPAADDERRYDTVWNAMVNIPLKDLPTVFELELALSRNWWRVKLLPEQALMAHMRTQTLMMIPKSDLVIEPEFLKVNQRKKFPIFALLKTESLTGKIYQQGYEQYLTWKGINGAAFEASDLFKIKRRTRRILRWLMTSILVIILLFVGLAIASILPYV